MNKRHLLQTLAASGVTLAWPYRASAVTYQDYMLHLINIERDKAGAKPLALGSNRAAQRHAELMMKFCHAGHWGVDGLNPYMRYSLAGGYQWNAENAGGRSLCVMDLQGSQLRLGNVAMAIHRAIADVLNSPGHRENMLDPYMKKVNIGLAWDEYSIKWVQHFEGDYVEFSQIPSIERSHLVMEGNTKNGSTVENDLDFFAAITYDPPPRMLTIGQLARSDAAYDNPGQIVAHLSPPEIQGRLEITVEREECDDHPYDVPADAPPPQTIADGMSLIAESKARSIQCTVVTATPPTVFARKWRVGSDAFEISVDISDLLEQYGKGVYTVGLWHVRESNYFSLYSIFHGIEVPAGYGRF